MTNQDILRIAMTQSAADLCADASDFTRSENVVVLSRETADARRYLKLPFTCQLVSYGSNVVASVSPEFREITEAYINRYPVEHLFETPNLHVLNDALMARGQRICFMAEYFLPEVDALQARAIEDVGPYEMRILTQQDFASLYRPEWSNALCEQRKHLDVLGVGAYDGDMNCRVMFGLFVEYTPLVTPHLQVVFSMPLYQVQTLMKHLKRVSRQLGVTHFRMRTVCPTTFLQELLQQQKNTTKQFRSENLTQGHALN